MHKLISILLLYGQIYLIYFKGVDIMLNYGLNDIYSQYEKTMGIRRELFGCLYKMYGGKKEIDSFSFETLWYIIVLDGMEKFNSDFKEKRLKFEKEFVKAENKKGIKKKFERESFEYYWLSFFSCVCWLTYYYNIKYENRKDKTKISYMIMDINNDVIYQSSFDLMYAYEAEQIHNELIKIYNFLKETKGLRLKDSVIQSATKDVLYIMSNTKLKIKEYFIPEFKQMLIC